MNNNEWPLVFFTLLSQISVGILIGGLALWLATKNSVSPAMDILKKVFIISAFCLMGIALLTSFLHLASPLHSIYALSNAGASWLSREIILASLYLFTLAICFTSLRFNVPHSNLFNQLYLASLIIGLVLIWAISRVYMIPTVPLWNTPATPVAFFSTTLLLGGSMVLLMISVLAGKHVQLPEITKLQSVMFYLVSFAVFITLLNMLLIQPDISAATGSFLLPHVSQWWKTARILFLLAGFSGLTYWFTYQLPSPGGSTSWLIYLSAGCLLLAEIAGKYIFYASYYRVGV